MGGPAANYPRAAGPRCWDIRLRRASGLAYRAFMHAITSAASHAIGNRFKITTARLSIRRRMPMRVGKMHSTARAPISPVQNA